MAFIYIYIYIYILITAFCGIIINVNTVYADSSKNLKLVTTMNDITLDVNLPDNTVNLNLDPTASLDTADTSVYVTTSASYGYTLVMTANSSDLTRTVAIDGNYPTIPTLATESTQVGFAPNHWGIKLSSESVWKPFNHNGVQIGYSDEAVTNKEEIVSFAAKANSATPTGTYEITFTIAAVANPKPVGIEDVVYMQDFLTATNADKSSILSSMTEGTNYTIKDSRDNQDYTVAKLFDGNIWMTKNLNLAGGTALNSTDSNVSAGCNLGNNCTLPNSSTSGFSNDSAAYVYNSNRTNCANPGCYSYYSFAATTAGTNPSSGNATSDICPAGWRLPVKTEFDTLVGTYNTGGKLVAAPFLAIYNGNYLDSSLRNIGSHSRLWSSTVVDSSSAYGLLFTNSEVAVSTYVKRGGFGVRCIVK